MKIQPAQCRPCSLEQQTLTFLPHLYSVSSPSRSLKDTTGCKPTRVNLLPRLFAYIAYIVLILTEHRRDWKPESYGDLTEQKRAQTWTWSMISLPLGQQGFPSGSHYKRLVLSLHWKKFYQCTVFLTPSILSQLEKPQLTGQVYFYSVSLISSTLISCSTSVWVLRSLQLLEHSEGCLP